jgi:large subunit ribosomal protein L32e
MKFLRRDAARYSKFGNGRGKKAKWRKPTGRDNKMREKRKGYQAVVSIGYGTTTIKAPVTVFNAQDLAKVNKEDTLLLGKVGKKKQIEIAKKAKDLGLKFKNMNVESFLKKLNKEEKKNESSK